MERIHSTCCGITHTGTPAYLDRKWTQEAKQAEDSCQSEQFLQQAEHYTRVINYRKRRDGAEEAA